VETSILEKMDLIKEAMAERGSILVALSGGVDSSVLAALARDALGEKSLAVTADSQTLPPGELEEARRIAVEIGIRHIVIPFDELGEPGFALNPKDRCYFCKKGLFRELKAVARENRIETIADGTNASDLHGHRPGHRAALEGGVYTPFLEFNVSKDDIRRMARILGLSVAEKPSMACLSSRFPYGQKITYEGLRRVGEAEAYLRDLNLTQVRVRDHSDIARIEVIPEEMDVLLKKRKDVSRKLKELGFKYVTLDLLGYRSGSMDEVI